MAKVLEEFLRGEVEPRIKEIEGKAEGLILELLKKGASMGWQGVEVPKEFGGFGLDSITSIVATEQASIGGPFALANMVHTTFGISPILYFGNAEQKNRYLPDLAKGKKIGAFALTEPDAGTDALNAKTTAILSKDGEYYILNGTKQFISNSGYADVFITYAKIDAEKFTAFIVERDFKGVSFGEEEDKMGIRGTSTRSITFENVKVPSKNVLFQPGKGHLVAFNTLNRGRHKLSVACIGSAKQALEDSIRYAKSRVQFGQSISNFGLIKEKIGEMAIRIFVGESTIYRTAGLLENGLEGYLTTSEVDCLELARRIAEYASECSLSKILGSEMLDYVVDEAVQIHGGYGYIKDYPVERYYRDSRINRIFGGTNEINRLLILKMLIKKISRGQLTLPNEMERLTPDILIPPDGPISKTTGLEELTRLVENAKKITLISLKTFIQTCSDDLEHHQEIMGMISNMMMEVFAGESILIRTQKIKRRWGEAKCEIPMAISHVYILDAFMRIEHFAKHVFAALAEDAILQDKLLILKNLTQYTPINSVVLRQKIADYLIKAGRYFIL
jgi:alkylation response protein AidB-like acyl-CoA dehydrogenase